MEIPTFLHTSEFVQPAELKVVPDTPAAERIYSLLMDHDGLTKRQISEKLRLVDNTVQSALYKLRHEGSIKQLPSMPGERRAHWVVGVDDEIAKRQEKIVSASQKTVYAWEPMKIQPQTPFSALFNGDSKQ